jgi:hypothetical protein
VAICFRRNKGISLSIIGVANACIIFANIIIVDIDIDTSIDLYVQLKAKKMVKGVPTILAFAGDVKRDQWYIPDDSVSGGNEGDVKNFLNRCFMKAKTLTQ